MKPRLLFLIRLALAVILAWAGLLKVLDPAAFAQNILNFRLVSTPLAAALALYIPWLELLIAAALLLPRLRTGATLLTALLFTLFAVLWIVTGLRGIDVTCGCFGGSGGHAPTAQGFLRALLPALAAWLTLRIDHPSPPHSSLPPAPNQFVT